MGGVGSGVLVVVLVVRCIGFGCGCGVGVFSMCRGFGVWYAVGVGKWFGVATFVGYVVVDFVVPLVGVLYFRSPSEFLVQSMLPAYLATLLFLAAGQFHQHF